MMQLANAMRAHAAMAMQERAAPRLAKVTSYDPVNYCVKVTLQPEGTETGWIPVLSPWIGNGWGLFCPPTPDDMVEIQFQEDSINAGFACLRFFTDSNRPLTVQSGEYWLVHKSGASIKLTNDGKTSLTDQAGTVLQLSNDGNVRITGNIIVSGLITGNAGLVITGTMTNNTKNIGSTHAHSGVTVGAGTTGQPI